MKIDIHMYLLTKLEQKPTFLSVSKSTSFMEISAAAIQYKPRINNCFPNGIIIDINLILLYITKAKSTFH